MKVGIFVGCFNPVHNMHKNIAFKLIEQKIVEKVIFVPTGDSYEKKDLAMAIHRFNMLKIICDKTPCMEVSEFEMQEKKIFTYETLDYFKNLSNDDIYLIIGADNLEDITNWKKYKYIIANYNILVVNRGEYDVQKFVKKLGGNIQVVNIEKVDISSTIIRNKIKNNEEVSTEFLDKDVMKYIKNNGLYI